MARRLLGSFTDLARAPFLFFLTVAPHANRAPIAVFIALGAIVIAIAVTLFLVIPIRGKDLWHGGTSYYCGPFGGFGGFGGL